MYGVTRRLASSWPDCLLKLKRRTQGVKGNIACGSHSLRSEIDLTINFDMISLPHTSYSYLELSHFPAPKNATAEQ